MSNTGQQRLSVCVHGMQDNLSLMLSTSCLSALHAEGKVMNEQDKSRGRKVQRHRFRILTFSFPGDKTFAVCY